MARTIAARLPLPTAVSPVGEDRQDQPRQEGQEKTQKPFLRIGTTSLVFARARSTELQNKYTSQGKPSFIAVCRARAGSLPAAMTGDHKARRGCEKLAVAPGAASGTGTRLFQLFLGMAQDVPQEHDANGQGREEEGESREREGQFGQQDCATRMRHATRTATRIPQ